MKTPKSLRTTSRKNVTLTQNTGKVSKAKLRYSLPDTGKLKEDLKIELLENSKQQMKKRSSPKKDNVQHNMNNSKDSSEKKKKSMTPEVKLGLEIEALIDKGSHSSKKARKTPTQGANKSPKISSLKKKNSGPAKPNSSFSQSFVDLPKSKTPSRRKSVFTVTDDNTSTPSATCTKKIKKSSYDSPIGFGDIEGGADVLNSETPILVSEKIVVKQTNFLKNPNANSSSSGKNEKGQMKGVEKHLSFTQVTPDNQEEKPSFRKTPFPQEKRKSNKKSFKVEEQDGQTIKSEKSDIMSEDDIKGNSSVHIQRKGKSGKKQTHRKKKLTSLDRNIGFENSEPDSLIEICYLDRSLALDAVKAMIKLHSINLESDKSLFDSAVNVGIQINAIKIPDTTQNFLYIKLPHPIIPDSANVCLFVKDLKGKIQTPETTEKHFKELLKQNNLTYIEVMPLSKLLKEYSTYNLKQRLVRSYDKFFVDGKIANQVFPALGKIFYRARKLPIALNLGENMVRNIERARCKCVIRLMAKGTGFYTEIGSTSLSEVQITDNIIHLAFGLDKAFPGGWTNIKSLFIKTNKTPFLPAYCSMLSPNDVPNPIVHIKKELPEPVKGELSTMLDAKVVVYPTGEVRVRKRKQEKDEDDDEELLLKEKIKRENEKKIKVEKDEEIEKGSDDDEEMEGDSEEDDIDVNFEGNLSLDSDENETDDNSEEGEGSEESGDDDDDDDNDDDDALLAETGPSSPLQDSSDEEAEVEAAEEEYLKNLRQSPIKEENKGKNKN